MHVLSSGFCSSWAMISTVQTAKDVCTFIVCFEFVVHRVEKDSQCMMMVMMMLMVMMDPVWSSTTIWHSQFLCLIDTYTRSSKKSSCRLELEPACGRHVCLWDHDQLCPCSLIMSYTDLKCFSITIPIMINSFIQNKRWIQVNSL